MRRLQTFARFWYDFLIGDDWTVAVAVTLAVAVTAAFAHTGGPAWLVMPIVVTGILWLSMWRARRATRP
jgi:hypothetical protein